MERLSFDTWQTWYLGSQHPTRLLSSIVRMSIRS